MKMPSSFFLSQEARQAIRLNFTEAVRQGLSEWRDGPGIIKALPSPLVLHDAPAAGRAIAIDTGGTRLRAAVVVLGREPRCLPEVPLEEPLPTGRNGAVTAEQFYAAHVRLVARLIDTTGCPRTLPIGWVFSYPAESTPDGDARLLAWTKELDIPEMVGTRVGAALRSVLAGVGIHPAHLMVLNDTVAVLLSGVARFRNQSDRYLGLVVGTGTNMAIALPRGQMPKLRGAGPEDEVVCINLESGNFDPGYLSEWDERLDQASANPGWQRFEKAVAGHYLPTLAAELVGTGMRREVAWRAVLDRSATLVATGIQAVQHACFGACSFGVVANGSLFWEADGYGSRVNALLDDPALPDRSRAPTVLRVRDDTLVGGAYAVILKT